MIRITMSTGVASTRYTSSSSHQSSFPRRLHHNSCVSPHPAHPIHSDQHTAALVFISNFHTVTRPSHHPWIPPIDLPVTRMPRRNPNRRRKSSRKTRAQSHDDWNENQAACYERPQYSNRTYADGDVIAAVRFSEDSICRQLGYERPAPPPQADLRPWCQAGCWYTCTHPFTLKDVVVWFDGVYWNEEEYYGGDGGSAYDHDVREFSSSSSSPPLFTYREGYHDPMLKDQAEDWWRLFGHNVPRQFILATGKALKTENTSCEDEHREEVTLAGQYGWRNAEAELMKEMGGEWDVAAYFAPYRMPETESCPGCVSTADDGKGGVEDKGEESGGCTYEIAAGKAVDAVEQICKGKDDWECDFCGIECFCWTVEADATEVW
jgi:hypothetical protein